MDRPGVIELDPVEAAHAIRVLRLREGDVVTLFDGNGYESQGRIESADRRSVSILVEASRLVEREPALRLTLAFAMPKGKHADVIIDEGTALGVAAFLPITTRFSVVDGSVRQEHRTERWQRRAIEVCKQCGRNRLPTIGECVPFDSLMTLSNSSLRLIAHPCAEATPLLGALGASARGSEVTVAIGPEGGFDDAEVASVLGAGFRAVSLGDLRLRAETAAIAVAAAVSLFQPCA